MKKIILTTSLIFGFISSAVAQDIHFTNTVSKAPKSALFLDMTNSTAQSCSNECNDDYVYCYQSGEDDRACAIDLYECYMDCEGY